MSGVILLKLQEQTSLLADLSDKNMLQTVKLAQKAIILVIIGEKNQFRIII